VLGTMGRSRGVSMSDGVGVGCAAAVVAGGAGGGWGGGGRCIFLIYDKIPTDPPLKGLYTSDRL
jgi:hypothetical protein